jgi:hypothetical protein
VTTATYQVDPSTDLVDAGTSSARQNVDPAAQDAVHTTCRASPFGPSAGEKADAIGADRPRYGADLLKWVQLQLWFP